MLNTPGTLKSVFDCFSELDVHVIYVATPRAAISVVDKAEFVLYVDLTDSPHKPEDIADRLKGKPFVMSVELMEPITKGLVIDTRYFPPVLGGERVIMIRESTMRALLDELEGTWGRTIHTLLYHVGLGFGRQEYRSHVGVLPIEARPAELVDLAVALFSNMGLGRMEVTDLSLKSARAVIRMIRSIECEIARRRGVQEPSAHFMRGVLAGWFSEFFRRPIKARERMCLAQGRSCCIIEVGPGDTR